MEGIGSYFELCLDEPVFALHQGKTYKAKVGIGSFLDSRSAMAGSEITRCSNSLPHTAVASQFAVLSFFLFPS
jgi:hypothetical protein